MLTALALTELIARYFHMKKILDVSNIVFDFVRGLLMEEAIPNFNESEAMDHSRWKNAYEDGSTFRNGVHAELGGKIKEASMLVF